MKTLKELRKEKEVTQSEAILMLIWGNYFKFENQKFHSFGRSSNTAYSVGSWFHCGEEEIERLREAILSGNFEVKKRIPRTSRIYRLPSDWMEE